MISDEVGGSENVNGSRIAMVVIGAIPGSTPTSVPISAPRKQKPRLAGVSATAKPVARLAKRSMRRFASPRPDRDRQAQHRDEQHDREDGKPDPEHGVLAQPDVVGGKARADYDNEARDPETRDRQQQREGRDRGRDHQQGPPRDLGKGLLPGERRADAQRRA